MEQIDDYKEEDTNGKNDVVTLRNPHVASLPVDHLYHIALDTIQHDLYNLFHDVKFVCFGGQPSRMETFINLINEELLLNTNNPEIRNYAAGTDRYCVYKAGPVLSVSHGIGMPSLSIVFNEIVKLMYYAKCDDVQFFRIGTSGGIGLEPGTVVLTDKVVDGGFSSTYKLFILGKKVERPAVPDLKLVQALEACARDDDGYQTVRGTTMCTEDFYEGQARLDGAFCDYTEEDKMSFMNVLSEKGVKNIEMESLGFLAMCRHAKIKVIKSIYEHMYWYISEYFSQMTTDTLNVSGAVVCVTLLDRLKMDYVTVDFAQLKQWQLRAQRVVVRYIKKQCGKRS